MSHQNIKWQSQNIIPKEFQNKFYLYFYITCPLKTIDSIKQIAPYFQISLFPLFKTRLQYIALLSSKFFYRKAHLNQLFSIFSNVNVFPIKCEVYQIKEKFNAIFKSQKKISIDEEGFNSFINETDPEAEFIVEKENIFKIKKTQRCVQYESIIGQIQVSGKQILTSGVTGTIFSSSEESNSEESNSEGSNSEGSNSEESNSEGSNSEGSNSEESNSEESN